MGKKITTEDVASYFKQYECELLSEYIAIKEEIIFKCSCGEIDITTFDYFKKNKHKVCKKCIEIIKKEKSTEQKLDIEYVKDYFKNENCMLLETEYINSKTKMKYICSCGNIDHKTWNHFCRGQRCKECTKEKRKQEHDKQRYSIEEVGEFFSKHGCELLEDEYANMRQILKHVCSCGEIAEKTFTTFKTNPKCTCNSANIPDRNRKVYNKEEIVEYFWKFFDENERYLNYNDLNNNDDFKYLKYDIKKEFGSFESFLFENQITSEDGWYKHDEQILIDNFGKEDIEDWIDTLMIKRHWATTLKKATKMGLREKEVPYAKEELLKCIIDFQKEYNRTPKIEDFKELGLPSVTVYRDNFGGWNESLKIAGLEPNVKYYNLSQTQKEITIKEYLDGYAVLDIAHRNNCSTSTIFDILRQHNITTRNKIWSEEQMKFLKKNYHRLSTNEIIKELKIFTKQNIYDKASDLGLRKEDVFWDDDELLILKYHYGKTPIKEIMELLPSRTYGSINSKAGKLGLDIYKEKWSEEELSILFEKYPIMSANELVRYLPKRNKNNIIDMANRLGLNKEKDYFYKNEHFRKQELLMELKEFANELGRTPHQDEITLNKEIASCSTYHRYFGSYTDACIEAGLEPNHKMFGNQHVLFDDYGYMHLSLGEMKITEYMIENNIDFIKSETLLYKNIFNVDCFGSKRMDWLINDDVAVEFFGMMDKNEYKIKANNKLRLCKTNGINVVSLYPEDLKNNLQGVKEKLALYIK